MITPTHVAMGAVVYRSIAIAVGAPPEAIGAAECLGAVLGGMPDFDDAINAWIGSVPRWTLYHEWHHPTLTWFKFLQWLLIVPALHTQIIDPPFHADASWTWFRARWIIGEVLSWALIVTLFLIVK
ncbi:MAG: hypothetical protein WCK00_03240 [Deltaproteobacteria bacterium]